MTDYSRIAVLVVDDEEAVRSSLSMFLEDYGFQTASCESAEDARDLMMEQRFDVVIVDIRLPGFSGEDLIRLASKRYPEQRYIIHTGSLSYALPDDLNALGVQPQHIFHKPIRVLNVLVKTIKELAGA